MFLLGSLLASAVVVHVAEVVELEEGQEVLLLSQLRSALEEVTEDPLVVVEASRGCVDPPACALSLGSVGADTAVVIVHLFGGLEHVQVLLRRLEDGAVTSSAEILIVPDPREHAPWVPAIRTLFREYTTTENVSAQDQSGPRTLWPWVAASSGAAAIAVAVAVGFAIEANALASNSQTSIDAELLDGARAHDEAVSAMFISAGIGAGFALIGGLLAILSD